MGTMRRVRWWRRAEAGRRYAHGVGQSSVWTDPPRASARAKDDNVGKMTTHLCGCSFYESAHLMRKRVLLIALLVVMVGAVASADKKGYANLKFVVLKDANGKPV